MFSIWQKEKIIRLSCNYRSFFLCKALEISLFKEKFDGFFYDD